MVMSIRNLSKEVTIMTTERLPERCVEHKIQEVEVLSRLKALEDDIENLIEQIKDKVDAAVLQDIITRHTKEIEELKKSVIKLNSADAKHSEALAGIYAILQGFKETQDLLRQDYSKLSDCYNQTSVHIASISAILQERAKDVDRAIDRSEAAAVAAAAAVVKDQEPATLWGTIKSVFKNKIVVYALVALIVAIIFILIGNQDEIMEILKAMTAPK